MHQRRLGAALLAAAAATLGFGGIAGADSATHSGAVAFHSVEVGNGKPLDILTGAIVDHGTDRSHGAYQEVVLSKGTFEVASAQLNKSFKITKNTTECYVLGVGHVASAAVSHGTGAYAGITGSISVTATFVDAGVMKNGRCLNLNSHSSASLAQFSGSGHVAY